jgi:hypothetical protein
MAKLTKRQQLDALKRRVAVNVDDLDRRMSETEDVLLERRAAAQPSAAPLLPVLRRPKRPRRPAGT